MYSEHGNLTFAYLAVTFAFLSNNQICASILNSKKNSGISVLIQNNLLMDSLALFSFY